MDADLLKSGLTQYAHSLGFAACGVAVPASIAGELDHHQQWLARGFAAQMDYLKRDPPKRYDPRALLPDCASVVVVAHSIYVDVPSWPATGVAKVARYAWGDDYHEVIGAKLRLLGAWLDGRVAQHRWKATVDSSLLSEKALAVSAGLGWRGGHSLVLNARFGSYFMLGCLLTSVQLPADAPVAERCGDCRLCINACPTGALVDFGVLDARSCISYANGSRRGEPSDVSQLAGWLYGCDACQQACPFNAQPPATHEPRFQPRCGVTELEAEQVLAMAAEEYSARFAGTVLADYGLKRLKRTAQIIAAGRDGSLRKD